VLAVVRQTHKQTHRQGRLQYTVQLSSQCNDDDTVNEELEVEMILWGWGKFTGTEWGQEEWR